MSGMVINKMYADLFKMTPEERVEHDATMIGARFLSEIEKVQKRKKITRKELAAMVGTSPSYLTQVFRLDKSPNMTLLAKMQSALGITFTIKAKKNESTKTNSQNRR
jgi:transcriptional regulator with XRE-family HTH domain